MKIPKSVRIGGVEYDVVEVPKCNDGNSICFGIIDYHNNIIELNPDMEHQVKCISFLHEVLHGIRNHFNMEIENEEKVVEMFSRGLYQVLQDNGGRLFDLQRKEESEKQ